MQRFCTECGKKFDSANNVCPWCGYKNTPIPAQIEEEELKKQRAKPHAMTIEEYEEFNVQVIAGGALGRLIRESHQHFVDQRRHDELIQEIRRLQ